MASICFFINDDISFIGSAPAVYDHFEGLEPALHLPDNSLYAC
jgi:hypothetical protein